MSNKNLQIAKNTKNDEFFTLYDDIEKELIHYKEQFKNKIVYCNCDDLNSNFVNFFQKVKQEWQIKDLWYTSISDGISFESEYAKDLLSKCDIVVTNPPFSLTRSKFVPLLINSKKQFLFIGNVNLMTMKDIFPLIQNKKLWTGYTNPKQFLQPDGTTKKFGNILWYTNMNVNKSIILNLDKHYYGNEKEYPRYDNYDAINVDRVSDIPCDYHGVIGVPITFIQKINPDSMGGGIQSSDLEKEQTERICDAEKEHITHESLLKFDIIGISEQSGKGASNGILTDSKISRQPLIKGKRKFNRLFIKIIKRCDF